MDQVKDNVKYIDESNFCINADAKVVKAAKQMLEKNLSALIVVGGGENWGVITETDLSRKIMAKELNPKETKVRFIMAKPIISIESNMSMMSAFLLMGSHKIRHVAVTEDGLIMGILSMKDFIGYYTKKFGTKEKLRLIKPKSNVAYKLVQFQKEQTATSINGITFKLTETKMIEPTAKLQCPLPTQSGHFCFPRPAIN